MSIKIFLIFVFILLMSGCYTTNSYRSYYAYPDSIKYSNSYHHYYHPRYRHKKFRSFYGFKYYRGHFYRPRSWLSEYYHVKEVLLSVPKFQDHDYVFTLKGKPIPSPDRFSRHFEGICKLSGIPAGRKDPNGVTFHDFRRTVKTNMLNAGIDKTHRDVILGHALQGMDVHIFLSMKIHWKMLWKNTPVGWIPRLRRYQQILTKRLTKQGLKNCNYLIFFSYFFLPIWETFSMLQT